MVGVNNAKSKYILFCDSSNIIKSNFVEQGLPHFNDKLVSACFGRIKNHERLVDSLSKWRGHHLFRQNNRQITNPHLVQCLITYAVLLRKEHIIKVGNFNPNLRQCEDQDMGDKLLNNNYKLLSDPELVAFSLRKESVYTLCLRYRRWHTHYKSSQNIIFQFLNTIRTSFFIFARQDIKNGDFICLVFSILLPFYLLFYDFQNTIKRLFKNEKH